MNRDQALSLMGDVMATLEPFCARIGMMGSSLVINGLPVAWINASNAIVVHPSGSTPAATFSKPGSAGTISALILERFVARKVA